MRFPPADLDTVELRRFVDTLQRCLYNAVSLP